MATPGTTIWRKFRVVNAAGTGVTGLTLASFTVTAGRRYNGAGTWASYSPSAAVTEIGTGDYWLAFTLPAQAGQFYVQMLPVSASNYPDTAGWEGSVDNYDFDSTAALVARPLVTVSGQGTIGQVTPLTIVNKRHAIITFSFTDQTGAAINMTSGTVYTNYKFGVRSQTDQTLTPPKLDAIHGTPAGWTIVGGSGLITVNIPMNASIFTLLEGATPGTTLTLDYELTGELVAISGERVSLVQSSPLTLLRREEGT